MMQTKGFRNLVPDGDCRHRTQPKNNATRGTLKNPGSIEYISDGPIAIVTFRRPTVRNALTRSMLDELHAVIDDFVHDDGLEVMILTGAGSESFCVGADLGETIPLLTEGDFRVVADDPSKRFFSDVYKPIISAVNGFCIAGGLEILLGTDLRIAADHATFGLTEVKWGIVPAAGSHVRLPGQIPLPIAMELLLTGDLVSAQRAAEIGLVNKVVPRDELMHEARVMAAALCENGSMAVRTVKEIAVRSARQEARFVLERYMSERVFVSDDAKEGPRAFLEKRAPKFSGK